MAQREKLVIPKRIREKYGENIPLWSFSRISTYENCSHEYFLSRIKRVDKEDNIYTLCGSAAHDIIEGYYKGDVKYEEMGKKFDSDFLDIEISDFKFSSDENRNNKMRNKYKECVSHFFDNHRPIDTKVLTETPIWVDIDGNIFIGYIDAITKDKEGNHCILDWKTSTIYTGEKIKQQSKQLLLYALGLHQAGIPLDKIKIAWNFVKYTSITYKLKNGRDKVSNAERNKWVDKIKTPLKKDIMELYEVDEWEADIKVLDCIRNNSLNSLIPTIRDKYKVDDCYVYADVNEEAVSQLKKEIVQAINDIKEKGDKEENWERSEIEPSEEFYCNVLCSVKKHCKFYRDHLSKKDFKQKEEDDLIENLLKDLAF